MPDAPDPDYDPNSATIPLSGPRPTLSGRDVDLPLPEELAKLLPAGAYEVTDFLGAGGMGAVYKGMQIRLKRPVAIKIMRRDVGKDHDFEARFEREAQAMAKLNHPNIISVIDFGEAGPDYLFIVMELVDGTDLMDVIRSKQMTQEMALTLLPQICDALQFAHDHGIVHRDIKPSNIMLTRDGRVKMADFGLAKHFDHAETGFRTQTGTGMGTPDYAAPEQFDPTTPVDHRADIYALGVMIYQMITGALPRGVWRPPSQRAPVSTHWDAVVSRAMQNDPSERYQKASEVKTELSSIPLVAKDGSTERSAGTPARPASNGGAAAKNPEAGKSARVPLIIGLLVGAVVITLGAFFALRDTGDGRAAGPPAAASSSALSNTQKAPATPNTALAGASALPKATTPAPALPESGWKPLVSQTEWQKYSKGTTDYQGQQVTNLREYKDGLLHMSRISLYGTQPFLNGAIRARLVMRVGSEGGGVSARNSGKQRYFFNLADQGTVMVLAVKTPESQAGKTLGSYRLPKPLQTDEKFTIELRIQGDQLTGLFNGQEVVRATDQRVKETGTWGIDSSDAWFESVEVQPLPAAATPLPIAAVEVQPLPAATMPVPIAAPALPESGWKPLFTEAEWKAKPGFKNGLLNLSHDFATKSQPWSDGAIRARIEYQGGSKAPSLVARQMKSGGFYYRFGIGSAGDHIYLAHMLALPQAEDQNILSRYFLPAPLKPGGKVLLELRVQGGRLSGLLDGKVVIEAQDKRLPSAGAWGITAIEGWFESVEVQPLPAAATPAPIAAPALPESGWQPLVTDADWRAVSPDREFADGLLHIRRNTAGSGIIMPQSTADAAIRARIRIRNGTSGPMIQLRQVTNKGRYMVGLYRPADGGYHVSLLRRTEGGKQEALGTYPLPQSPREGDTLALELRAQEDRLTVLVDGIVRIEANDKAIREAGNWGIQANEAWFESVEVQPLPAAESPTAAEPWRDWIAEKRAEKRLASLGFEDDGTYVQTRGAKGGPGWKPIMRDGAIRVTWKLTGEIGKPGQREPAITLRHGALATPPQPGSYTLAFGQAGLRIDLHAVDASGQPQRIELKTWPLPPGFDRTQEHTLEFRAVGDELSVRLNGQLIGTHRDTRAAEGGVGFFPADGALIRKVEYLNLDGPPGRSSAPVASSPSVEEEAWIDAITELLGTKPSGPNWKREGAAILITKAGAFLDSKDATLADFEIRITARAEPGSNASTSGWYGIFRDRKVWLAPDGKGAIHHASGGQERWLAKLTPPPDFDITKDHTVEIRLVGDRITVLINGIEAGSASGGLGKAGGFSLTSDPGMRFSKVDYHRNPLPHDPGAGVPAKSAAVSTPSAATKSAPSTNSLGMKFVPVPGTQVLFSIWHTRVQDYAEFAKAQEAAGKKVDGAWKTQQKDGVPVGREPDHPVVGVRWDDAQAFCAWLTAKETAEGKLPKGAKYRLPTDAEWSTAVGLPPETGATPEEKNGKNSVDFPWGKNWPPTNNGGNYADETFHAKFPVKRNEKENRDENLWIESYDDGFPTTSPVGAFPANSNGLYDMSGNVFQFCDDWWNTERKDRVSRGGSWNRADRGGLKLSYRGHGMPSNRQSDTGFRCVLELGPSTAAVSPAPNLPVSKSSDPKFPPGQWVKVFTKMEDLPEANRPNTDPQKWDGWIPAGSIDMPVSLTKNYGVRARFRAAAEKRDTSYLILRDSKANNSSISLISPGTALSSQLKQSSGFTTVFQKPSPRPVRTGEDFTLEFAAIGVGIVGRLNADVLQTANDIPPFEGPGRIVARDPVRDIEVINLDGLPEAEALRLLGVDEQGKDLRGKTDAAK
jgi:formylglycine-generating enzyme required for sulfatase activity/predicted Ser/Thr protein kinase